MTPTQLGNIRDRSVLIDKRIYKGDIDTPEGRKGKRTARMVLLSPGAVQELALWRDMLLAQKADRFLFPTERNTPLSRDNVWNRHMARKASIDDDKVTVGVSLEVYSQNHLEQ